MTIQEGYNGKPLHIKISGNKWGNGEMWLVQEGDNKEVLVYASLMELLALKREIDNAMMQITGLSEEL